MKNTEVGPKKGTAISGTCHTLLYGSLDCRFLLANVVKNKGIRSQKSKSKEKDKKKKDITEKRKKRVIENNKEEKKMSAPSILERFGEIDFFPLSFEPEKQPSGAIIFRNHYAGLSHPVAPELPSRHALNHTVSFFAFDPHVLLFPCFPHPVYSIFFLDHHFHPHNDRIRCLLGSASSFRYLPISHRNFLPVELLLTKVVVDAGLRHLSMLEYNLKCQAEMEKKQKK